MQISKVKITVQNSKFPLVPLFQRGKQGSLPFEKGELERDFKGIFQKFAPNLSICYTFSVILLRRKGK